MGRRSFDRNGAERVIEGSRVRLTVIGVVILFLFSALFARLWFLQVAAGNSSTAAAASNRVRVVYEPALRGRILDRYGRPIVDNSPVDVVTVERHKPMPAAKRKLVLGRLAEQLGLSVEEVEQRIDDRRSSPFAPARVATGVPPDVRTYIEERKTEFPGVNVVRTAVRAYPSGVVAANLMGYVGEVNSDDLKAHAAEGYREGDLIGKDGVEKIFEGVLRGTPRKLKVEVDSRGRVQHTTEERKPVPGKDVQLTIDIDAQRIAEESLAQGMDGARGVGYRASAGTVVVLDPNDGSVVAMASNPTYDPGAFATGMTPEQYQMLNNPAGNFPLVNRAVSGLYAPGSTFKLFTAIAGMETGQLDPNAGFLDQGYVDIGNQRRYNAGRTPHGTVNLASALTVSSDAYFYEIGRDMWQSYNRWEKAKNAGQKPSDDDINKGYAIQHTAEAYGFGKATGIGLGGESDGRVPDQVWKERVNANEPDPRQKRERSLWLPGDNVSLAVGQGDLLVTPLQLATAYATFANGGTLFTPRVAGAVLEPGTGLDERQPVIRELPAQPLRKTDLNPGTRDAIMQGLIGVTSAAQGTASGAFAGLSFGSVAGKTGTAEHTEGGKQDDSLFVGITHPDRPQYVVLAVVEEGGFGASVAAPIARRVINGLEGNPNPTPVGVQPAPPTQGD